jgi:hypothetical protein
LSEAYTSECPCLKDVSSFSSLERLEIEKCIGLVTIPSLLNVKELDICDCPNLSDLRQLNWKIDFIHEKRVVRLSKLPFLIDFAFCQNIYSLRLTNLSGLTNCQRIGNIHHLTIEECENLTCTDGLGKVIGKCILLKNGSTLAPLNE